MSRFARSRTLFRLAALLLSPSLFGQFTPSAIQRTTFHISGTITGGRSLAVVFEGPSSKTVRVSKSGTYAASLPLGLWTMTVVTRGLYGEIFTKPILYRRPPFRITVPTTLVFDITLPAGIFCTLAGDPMEAQEEKDHKNAWCAGEEFFRSLQAACHSKCTCGEERAFSHATFRTCQESLRLQPATAPLPHTTACRCKQMRSDTTQ